MNKVFFDHLVALDDILGHLDTYDLDVEEKAELISLIDETFHHHTLNIIFNYLPVEKHSEFVEKMRLTPADEKLMDYLKAEIKEDIETEIKKQADRIKKEILAEIKKSKKRG